MINKNKEFLKNIKNEENFWDSMKAKWDINNMIKYVYDELSKNNDFIRTTKITKKDLQTLVELYINNKESITKDSFLEIEPIELLIEDYKINKQLV